MFIPVDHVVQVVGQVDDGVDAFRGGTNGVQVGDVRLVAGDPVDEAPIEGVHLVLVAQLVDDQPADEAAGARY